MRRPVPAVLVGGCGLFVGLAWQAIWQHAPADVWAACAVVGVLSSSAMMFETPLVRVTARLTPRP